MVGLDRRTFSRGAAVAAGGAVLGGPFQGFVARAARADPGPRRHELGPVPDRRDGAVRLWLPAGFHYRSFHDTEFPVVLDDGTALPGRHDGMAAFDRRGGTVVLVRNHEINGPGPAFGDAAAAYDPMAQGGTTTVEATRTGEVLRSYTSLNGTQMNCSGGPMPWGSWVTCEETVNGPDVGPDFTGAPNVALTKPHGFIFEVPSRGQSDREPVTAAGRFAHEAVALDPRSGALYLTEDNFGFPYTPGETAPTTNNQAIVYVGNQGRARGAAYFSRLEGATYDDGVVYFTSTQGGGPAEESLGPIADGYGNGHGQIWGYDVRERVLRLLHQSPGPDVLDFPDNVTTSPRGTLVVCEDNVDDNYLRGLTQGGRLFDIALNRLVSSTGVDRSNDEFAGSTFSPDGHTLFVNIQASRGMTFAIGGPWHSIGV